MITIAPGRDGIDSAIEALEKSRRIRCPQTRGACRNDVRVQPQQTDQR